MPPTFHPIQVTSATPLLRVVFVLVLMLAAIAGMLVASSAHIGWVTLGFAVVAGPVAVVVDGRSRNRARGDSQRSKRPIPVPSVTRETSAAPA